MHTVIRRPCNHVLHAVLTFLTCGLWAFVWVPMAVIGRREHVTVDPRWYNPPLPSSQGAPSAQWHRDPVTGEWYTR